MSITHKIFPPKKVSQKLLPWISHLLPFARRLANLPPLRPFKSLALKARAVMEPPPEPSGIDFRSHITEGKNEPITVLSANLWHDWPKHRRQLERLEAYAQMVEQEKADIVLFQEVARRPNFRADEWLAKRLGMAYYYSRANGNADAIGFEEGLAVFSRFPLGKPRLHSLGADAIPLARRWALSVEVETHVGKLMAVSTHLAVSPIHNKNQLVRLRTWVASMSGQLPVFIGGDFNTHESSTQISQAQNAWLDIFRHVNPYLDGTTFEMQLPCGIKSIRRRFDYLFLRPGSVCWNLINARHLHAPGGPHSDHRAVLARMVPIPCV